MNIYQLRSLLTKAGAKHLAKSLYHSSNRAARKSIKFILNIKPADRLVYITGGRIDGWPDAGRELYHQNQAFKETIRICDTYLKEIGGPEILSYFEGPANPSYFEEDSNFTYITAIQIATINHYHSQGIYPNAVMGISLGEPASAYAAGALTLEETLRISLSYLALFKDQTKDCTFILLNLPIQAAQQFCSESPVWTEVIFESTQESVLVTCHKKDTEQLKSYFEVKQQNFRLISEKTSFPYHTSVVNNHYDFLKQVQKEIVPKPLKCDYYSATLGRKIPKDTIFDADYWCDVAIFPVLFHTSLQALLNDGYKTFFQIGPPGISNKQIHTGTIAKIKVLNSFSKEPSEIQYHKELYKTLSKIKFQYSFVCENEAGTLFHYKHNFNVYAQASSLPFEYLRRNGTVHFLPQHNAWLLLGYDDIENALKQPNLFSSSILKGYDPILLGADPYVHKIIRGLLQPLFSPSVISELAEFTSTTARAIIEDLCKQDEFDFVKDYSDPLTLLSLCNFFGLSSEDADHMLAYTGKDYHNINYWQRLEEFFNNNFSTIPLTKTDSLWGKLRELVEKDQFLFTDASSLLKIIWTAGMATTSALISVAVNTALRDHELALKISTDDKLVSKFIEECLRVQTSITSVHRITTEDIELGGQHLPANSMVMLNLKMAMADPVHYSNPQEFSISRPAKKHLAFGTGIHQCIGMGIARAEARSALQIMLTKLPELMKYNFNKPTYSTGSDLETMTSLRLYK